MPWVCAGGIRSGQQQTLRATRQHQQQRVWLLRKCLQPRLSGRSAPHLSMLPASMEAVPQMPRCGTVSSKRSPGLSATTCGLHTITHKFVCAADCRLQIVCRAGAARLRDMQPKDQGLRRATLPQCTGRVQLLRDVEGRPSPARWSAASWWVRA